MVNETIIEGLREYLKDHYIPSRPHPAAMACACEFAEPFVEERSAHYRSEVLEAEKPSRLFLDETPEICGYAEFDEDESVSLRDISDDATDYIKKHRKPGGFSHALDKKREEKGLTPVELYKKANVDRRQYSRFMGPEGRHPSMNTVISFAFALRLNRTEFDELLQTAGYALSNSSTRDVCVMYCLENNIYSVDDVNALLFAIGIEPLTRE